MTRDIVFTKNQATHEISGVPEDAVVEIKEVQKEGDTTRDLYIYDSSKRPMCMIRNVESFTDKSLKIGKLKTQDWIGEGK